MKTRFLSLVGGVVLLAAGGVYVYVSAPADPPRTGPAPAWSRPLAGGPRSVAVAGDVVITADDRTVIGLTRAAGKELWRRTAPAGFQFSLAGGLAVIRESEQGPVEVVDPVTGTTRWRSAKARSFRITQDAVYSASCTGESRCEITSQDIQHGRERWSVPSQGYGLGDEFVATRRPYAPAIGSYLPAAIGPGDKPWAALDVKTGRALPARASQLYAIDRTLISTQDAADCMTTIAAIDGPSRWTRTISSGRDHDGECAKSRTAIGAGSRLAASTDQGAPQVLDLATGRTIWAARKPGVPIDGDGRTLLVRRHADRGELTLLDFGTGRTLWRAPDPGLSGDSASWQTGVTRTLVAVTGASDDHPYVLVHRIGDGKRRGRFPGWLAGLGDDWVAVTHTSKGELTLDYIPL